MHVDMHIYTYIYIYIHVSYRIISIYTYALRIVYFSAHTYILHYCMHIVFVYKSSIYVSVTCTQIHNILQYMSTDVVRRLLHYIYRI